MYDIPVLWFRELYLNWKLWFPDTLQPPLCWCDKAKTTTTQNLIFAVLTLDHTLRREEISPPKLLGIEMTAEQICPCLGKARVCLYGNEMLGSLYFKVSTSLKTACEQQDKADKLHSKLKWSHRKKLLCWQPKSMLMGEWVAHAFWCTWRGLCKVPTLALHFII